MWDSRQAARTATCIAGVLEILMCMNEDFYKIIVMVTHDSYAARMRASHQI